MKTNYLIILLFTIISCTGISKRLFKDKEYSVKNIINSNTLIIPVNLTYIESGIFNDQIKEQEEYKEILNTNQIFLKEFVRQISKYKIEYEITKYDENFSRIYNELWSSPELEKTRTDSKEAIKLYSTEKIRNYAYISCQPILDSMIKYFMEYKIEFISSGSFIKPDYYLFYKVNHKVYSSPKKATVISAFILAMLLGGGQNAGPDSVIGDFVTLQILLIDIRGRKVICFGEFTEQKVETLEASRGSIKKMLNFLFEIRYSRRLTGAWPHRNSQEMKL